MGRTEDKLKKAAQELGHNTTYYVLDTGKTSDIAPFCKKITSEHPELDCVINNAGVQRPLDINDFSLEKADQEIAININGPMHLAMGLLEHLKGKEKACIMNVSSVLGFIPFSIINPVYNGLSSAMLTPSFSYLSPRWTSKLLSKANTPQEQKHGSTSGP